MNDEIFLWPQALPFRISHFVGATISTTEIEAHLSKLYPDCDSVLFSSARAGLLATLKQLGLSRPELVWCPPFSSHCIFDAISRIATPTTQASATPVAALIYHQWGHVHTHSFPATTSIIEDAVDTLLIPGSPPFAIDGRFVLWSLPKVIASHCGGVVFCRNRSDAEALRQLRDQSILPGALQTLLRVLGDRHPLAAAYWHGAEANGCKLPTVALRQIKDLLEQLPDEVEARKNRLARLQPFSLAPLPPESRLPANLPWRADPELLAPLPSGRHLSAGIRNFNLDQSAQNSRFSQVIPIPLHQDINGTDIAELVARANLSPTNSA